MASIAPKALSGTELGELGRTSDGPWGARGSLGPPGSPPDMEGPGSGRLWDRLWDCSRFCIRHLPTAASEMTRHTHTPMGSTWSWGWSVPFSAQAMVLWCFRDREAKVWPSTCGPPGLRTRDPSTEFVVRSSSLRQVDMSTVNGSPTPSRPS